MRSATFVLAGSAAAASAQVLTTITGRVQTATISASETTFTTTWTYSNPATNYLSLTNSEGVVTGLPSNTADTQMAGMPEAVTSQPAVATIPAGLPTGETYVPYNGTAGLTSFQVSVGSSTTMVIGASPTDASITTGGAGASSTAGSGSGSGGAGGSNSNSGNDSNSGSGSGSSNSDNSASGSASASASQSGNAASSVQVAGAGVGLFAFIAALL